ncbi:MAG: sporulation protein YqfD [Thermaerobacter sp.]|nr:sporulation protein YqfD [Bacillota bacterium]
MRRWAYLLGAVRVRVRGDMPERLLNLSLDAGVPLWDVVYQGDRLLAWAPAADLIRLRDLARRAGCRLRVVDRRGLPFTWRRLRRRRTMILAAAAVLLALHVFGSFVWFFEVRGNETLTDAEILEAAAAAGLRPGAWRPGLDRDAVARDMIMRVPALAWVGLEFVGTRVIITVAEKVLPPEETPTGPGDLVAERAGIIEDVLVLQGEAAVSPGETVVPGQVLIRGLIEAPPPAAEMPPPGEQPPALSRRPVAARGRVLARTWYEGYIEVPLVEHLAVRTGRFASQRRLALAGREIVVGGPRRVPFARYEAHRVERPLPPWAGEGAAFRLVTVTFYEIEETALELTPEQAAQEARRRLEARLLGRLDVDARIQSVKAGPPRRQGSHVSMRMVIEVIEDIGRFEPHPAPPDPGDAAPEAPQDAPPGAAPGAHSRGAGTAAGPAAARPRPLLRAPRSLP